MITPSYSLTATERVLPKLALDFTTAALDPRVTFTRTGNTATVTNSSGVIVGVNADIPRFDFDPVTLVCRGLLIEESRTNEVLNSLLDGTSLATQTVVVTAAARTLSFYGTGQIVLSGAASATVTGTGAYPTRTTLTFTPSAGALTLTVTGTVQFAQLELGSFATSFIPTAAAVVTRNADIASLTGANFSSWFNASEGTIVVQAEWKVPAASTQIIYEVHDGTANNRYRSFRNLTSTAFLTSATVAGVASVVNMGTANPLVTNTVYKTANSYKTNLYRNYFTNDTTLGEDTSSDVIAAPTTFQIGTNYLNALSINGYVQKILYWPMSFTVPEMRAFSAI
jgi:hypothetical protein